MQTKLATIGIGAALAVPLSIISMALAQHSVALSNSGNSAGHFEEGSGFQGDKPFDQEQALADLRKKIEGQETKPAAEVFKNIQILKGMPAGRLLKVMELGYARSLGVNCTHCHTPGEWAKEDKPTKQVARDMMAMVNTINSELLKKIQNLKSTSPTVNCTTCHRGQIRPELNLTDKPRT